MNPRKPLLARETKSQSKSKLVADLLQITEKEMCFTPPFMIELLFDRVLSVHCHAVGHRCVMTTFGQNIVRIGGGVLTFMSTEGPPTRDCDLFCPQSSHHKLLFW